MDKSPRVLCKESMILEVSTVSGKEVVSLNLGRPGSVKRDRILWKACVIVWGRLARSEEMADTGVFS